MKVAIFGKHFPEKFTLSMVELLDTFRKNNIQLKFYQPFFEYLQEISCINGNGEELFSKPSEITNEIDFVFCIGGDGTFLKCLPFVRHSNIPIVGVNSGRLGFLTNIAQAEIAQAIEAIVSHNFQVEERSMLSLSTPLDLNGFDSIALNEITVQKNDSNIISVNVSINNNFLNTYWTDGLIVASPTGSTAYALSIGGPVVQPGAKCILIAPIASHNLTVRPLIIPENSEISLEVRSRSGSFLITADNQTSEIANTCHSFVISKSKETLKLVKFPFNNYYSTLRTKLMWGSDKRNW